MLNAVMRKEKKNKVPKGARLRWKILRREPGLVTIEHIDVFPFDKIYHGCELWRVTRRMVFLRGVEQKIFWSVPIPKENALRGWQYIENLQDSAGRAWSDFCEERKRLEKEREYEGLS